VKFRDLRLCTSVCLLAGYRRQRAPVPFGSGQHYIDPAAVPGHAGAISIGLLVAWVSLGIDLTERLRIALCGWHGPERARQLMASVPNSYEAWQLNGQPRSDRPCAARTRLGELAADTGRFAQVGCAVSR
jgi:hypothetical protein